MHRYILILDLWPLILDHRVQPTHTLEQQILKCKSSFLNTGWMPTHSWNTGCKCTPSSFILNTDCKNAPPSFFNNTSILDIGWAQVVPSLLDIGFAKCKTFSKKQLLKWDKSIVKTIVVFDLVMCTQDYAWQTSEWCSTAPQM